MKAGVIPSQDRNLVLFPSGQHLHQHSGEHPDEKREEIIVENRCNNLENLQRDDVGRDERETRD
jgi:hypothetical protein